MMIDDNNSNDIIRSNAITSSTTTTAAANITDMINHIADKTQSLAVYSNCCCGFVMRGNRFWAG